MNDLAQDLDHRIARRLKLRDLRALEAVARCGSMARGARELGLSQPAVSEAIANLEAALRVRLLERSTRGVAPTIYATALLRRACVVFDELAQGLRDIAFLSHAATGTIRVGCPESLAAGFLPAVIARLAQRYPNVSVDVVSAQPGEQVFAELHGRSVDILLGRLFRPVRDPAIAVETLGMDAFRVVAGTRHPLCRRRRLRPGDLRDAPWILFPETSVSGAYIADGFRAQGEEPPRAAITSFSMQLRFHLLAGGGYLTVLHDSVLRFNARHWSLRVLPVSLPVPPMPIAIFSLRNRTLSPVVGLFVDTARAIAKDFPPPDPEPEPVIRD